MITYREVAEPPFLKSLNQHSHIRTAAEIQAYQARTRAFSLA
jgi:hypothetical protein